MAKIVIKKKVELGFLGEEYKEDYLVFKAMSVAEYEELLDKLEPSKEDNKQSVRVIREILEKQFIEGKFQNEEVTKEDLKQFDLGTLTTCFETFTGGNPDPKV